MTGLESQQEDTPIRILFFKPMSCLGQIRSHRRDESWSVSLFSFFTMIGTQIPVIVENLLPVCGCRKFQLDTLGDHLCTCTTHSGVKKVHDWTVGQFTELFLTSHKVKPKHVTKSRGRHCSDVDLTTYLTNTVGPVSLVLDLHITHDRFDSRSDLYLNGHLHYPNNIDRSLNETDTDKIRKYRSD
jgi:hypothetical protein